MDKVAAGLVRYGWAVAVPAGHVDAIDVFLPRRQYRAQSLGNHQSVVRRAGQKAVRAQCLAPRRMALIADDQIDATGLEMDGGSLYNGFFLPGKCETVDDGPQPHVVELLVIGQLGIENDRPTQVAAGA